MVSLSFLTVASAWLQGVQALSGVFVINGAASWNPPRCPCIVRCVCACVCVCVCARVSLSLSLSLSACLVAAPNPPSPPPHFACTRWNSALHTKCRMHWTFSPRCPKHLGLYPCSEQQPAVGCKEQLMESDRECVCVRVCVCLPPRFLAHACGCNALRVPTIVQGVVGAA